MFLIRNCFVAKPGQASKLAAQMKEVAAASGMPNARVLTDVTGDFNRVFFEFETESLGEFESRMQQRSNDPAMKEKMSGYTDLWQTGHREVLKIW